MPRLEGVRRQRRASLLHGHSQRGDDLGGDPVGVAPEAVTLDHEPDVEDLLEIVVPQRTDVGPAVRPQREQAFRFQDANRLADRGAAEREVTRELRLVHALAGRELTLDDRLAEMARDLGRQRRWLLESFRHRASAPVARLLLPDGRLATGGTVLPSPPGRGAPAPTAPRPPPPPPRGAPPPPRGGGVGGWQTSVD